MVKLRLGYFIGEKNGSLFSSHFFNYYHNDDCFCYNKSLFYGVSVRQIQTNQAWFPETVKTYAINKTVQEFSFWDLANVPQGSKKHKGMCNGSIVDCYVYVTDTLFAIFKPNTKCKTVLRTVTI